MYASVAHKSRSDFSCPALLQPRDFNRPAAGFIDFNDRAVENDIVFGHFKPLRHGGEKPLNDRLNFPSQHALMRAGKTRVAQVRRAAGENLLIRRLHVSVRAHHRADLAIQHPRERDFFRGGLGVKIHKDDFRLLAHFFHFLQRPGEGIFELRLHERAPLQVQHPDGKVAARENPASPAGNPGGIIERAEKSWFVRQQFQDLLLVPEMVAAGDDIDAGGKNLPGGFEGNARTAGGVLPVGDDKIQAGLLAQFRQERFDRVASGLADDVADE